MLSQALNVFDFLKIKYPKNSQKKAIIYYPLIFSLLASSILLYLAISNNYDTNFFVGKNSGDLFTLMAILPGFYIASLGAISAINKPAIDKIINEKNAPYLTKRNKDQLGVYNQPLTRRVFLSMLFAYLASVSLLTTLILSGLRFLSSLNIFSKFIYLAKYEIWGYCLSFIINLTFFFILTQLVILTLVGINYLGYKSLVDE